MYLDTECSRFVLGLFLVCSRFVLICVFEILRTICSRFVILLYSFSSWSKFITRGQHVVNDLTCSQKVVKIGPFLNWTILNLFF